MKTLFKNILLSLLLVISSVTTSNSQHIYGNNKIISASTASPLDSFQMEITTIGASESFTFPFFAGTYTNCTIDFGDGGGAKTIASSTDSNRINVYAVANTYTIIISADACGGINFNSVTPYDKRVDDIIQWGTIPMEYRNFDDCSNMVVSATDIPDFSSSTSFVSLFDNCSSITSVPNIGSWDVSGISDFTSCFFNLTTWNPDVGGWNVSSTATNMTSMFLNGYVFNRDISGWDVSGVTTFNAAFQQCRVFNQDLSGWTINTSASVNMNAMFSNCWAFTNGGISLNSWNTSKVTSFSSMFNSAFIFNQTIDQWDFTSCTSIGFMFHEARAFNQSIATSGAKWDVSNIADFGSVFEGCDDFDKPLSTWVTTSATQMDKMFERTDNFNQDISNFDTSGVTNFQSMFGTAKLFNQDIDSWDVSASNNFIAMFSGATVFNQNLNSWTFKVTGNTNCNSMFANCTAFNGNITSWTTTRFTDTRTMFSGCAAFNQNISSWDMSNVTIFQNMFTGATIFNQPIGAWTTTALTNVSFMFSGAGLAFNQDLSNWDVSGVTNYLTFFALTNALSTTNYDLILVGWDAQAVQSGETVDFGDAIFTTGSAADTARANLISSDSWTINDGGGT